MSIRIGSSCALSTSMAIGNVVETRRFLNYDISDWLDVSQKSINEKKFLIVTICIDKNNIIEYFPSEFEWRIIVEDTKIKLLDIGANWNNCRVDIINEPVKPRKGLNLTKEQYVDYINIAHSQMRGKLPIGAGCEEPITAQAKGDMIPYICRNSNFEYLIIHIQGSCDSEAKTVYWINTYRNYAITYKKHLDCNEANLKDPCTSVGFNLLKAQLNQAEKAGIPNFPIVFENLDISAFIGVKSEIINYFKTLSFQVNGVTRCPRNYNDWINIIEAKAPVPNIIEPIIEGKDGMILPTTKYGSKGYLAELVQELLIELGFYNGEIDGQFFTDSVNALKDFQTSIKDKYPNIDIDGSCGRKGYYYLINEIADSDVRKRYQFKLNVYASPVK